MKTTIQILSLFLLTLLVFGFLLSSGCSNNPPEKDIEPEEEVVYVPNPIKILVVGDDVIGPRIVRQWKARRDGEVELVNSSVEAFIASGLEIEPGIDVVIYPPGFLGELAQTNKIIEVPKTTWNSDDLNKNELLKHFRMSVVRYANEPWALPLGSPNFAMFCDREKFEKANLVPPETWEKIETRLEKLGGSTETAIKIDLPMAKGWAATSFLARVAPTIRHRGALSTVFERNTMKPLIAQKPFVDSLEQLKRVASPRSLEHDPKGIFDLVANGQSPIAFTWPASGFSNTGNEDEQNSDDGELEGESNQDGSLIVSSLPGVKRWFDYESNMWNKRDDINEIHVDLVGFHGLVASVPTTANDQDTAWEFMEWLPSKSISLLTMVDSPNVGPFRASHLGDVGRWTGSQLSVNVCDRFADVVSDTHSRPLILIFPRILNQHEYFNILDDAVRDYITSDRSAQEVLTEVATKWEEVTERIGRIPQVKALRRESGF